MLLLLMMKMHKSIYVDAFDTKDAADDGNYDY